MSDDNQPGTSSYERDSDDPNAKWYLVTITRSTIYRVRAENEADAEDAALDGGGSEVDGNTEGATAVLDDDQTSGDERCPKCGEPSFREAGQQCASCDDRNYFDDGPQDTRDL